MIRVLFIAILLFSLLPLQAEGFKDLDDYRQSVEKMRHFSFEMDRDRNAFPDEWFLEKGPEFQRYHSILLDSKVGHIDQKSLRFLFTGGNYGQLGRAGLHTAALKLPLRYAYQLSLFHKSENLSPDRNHRLDFGIRFFNDKNQFIDLQNFTTQSFSKDWTKVNFIIESLPESTQYCQLYIHLSGHTAGSSKLWVDDVHIEPIPRIDIHTNRKLNIFKPNEPLVIQQVINGTDENQNYFLRTEVRNFRDEIIDSKTLPILGSLKPIQQTYKVPIFDLGTSGVYYIDTHLIQGQNKIRSKSEIISRESKSESNFKDPKFGVVLGRPTQNPEDLIISLAKLGVQLSKLELLPDSFSLKNYDHKNGLIDLNPLLVVHAPENDYKFIGLINKIPSEIHGHENFILNPATHVLETLTDELEGHMHERHGNNWEKTFHHLLLKYSNVLSHWQFGDDGVPVDETLKDKSKPFLERLNKKAGWMKAHLPDSWDKDVANAELYIPAEMSVDDLKKKLASRQQTGISATVELDNINEHSHLKILENLVKKVTMLKSGGGLDHQRAKPLVDRLFIDRLSDAEKGLMTPDFKPRSSFFAVRTIAQWFQHANYIGSLTFEDEGLVNHVFEKDKMAFVIMWRATGPEVSNRFWLGSDLKQMDLMGNESPLATVDNEYFDMALTSTPTFFISPHPELFKTMISFQLHNQNLEASVKLQEQKLSFKNYFNEKPHIEAEVIYPSDWLLRNQVFDADPDVGETKEHTLQLSPSALSPTGDIKVWTLMNIALEKHHHKIRLFRRDQLKTDVQITLKFYKAKDGLDMDISLGQGQQPLGPNSFVVSASFNDPNIDNLEALFKDVPSGESLRQTLFILNGQNVIGKKVFLKISEQNGDRYINKSFDIKLAQ